MLGFWINYGTDAHISVNSEAQWIVPLALQLVPGVLLFLGILWCPESPRWLAREDDFDGAERILCKIRGLARDHQYVRREMTEIRTQVEERSTNRMSRKEQ